MKGFLTATGSGLVRAVMGSKGRWQVETFLKGQGITCLAADPLREGLVYAGTRGKGLLCSTDGGRNWAPLGLAGQDVRAVCASPIQPGLIVAGTRPAKVYVSADSGQRWSELTAFRAIPSRRLWFSPAEPPFTACVQGIALSPSDPGVILVGIEAGAVVRSADGGRTWQDHRPGALRDCHSITFHAADGAWVYEAGGTGVGAAVSRDGGAVWSQPKAGLDRHYGWACAADPLSPEISYVSLSPSPLKAHGEKNAEACLFRSSPEGWRKLEGGLPQPLRSMPYALLTHPSEPGCVYAGLGSGEVWRSADCGESWSRLPVDMRQINRCMILLP